MAPPTYPSRGAWRFTNVTRDFDFWPTLESISITSEHPDMVAAFSCRVVDEGSSLTFGVEDEVVVMFRDTRIWAGHLKTVGQDQVSEVGPRVWVLAGQDYTAKLDDAIIRRRRKRKRESAKRRVRWLLRSLERRVWTLAGIDLSAVPDESVEAYDYYGATVAEGLAHVADELRLHAFIELENVFRMARTESVAAPFGLDDESPDYVTTFPFREWRYDQDSVDLANAILTEPEDRKHSRWVTDAASVTAYGRQERFLSDGNVAGSTQARRVGERTLAQAKDPELEGHLVVHEPGIAAGMTVHVRQALWGEDADRFVRAVEIGALDPHDADGTAYLVSTLTVTAGRRRRLRGRGGRGGDGSVNRLTRRRDGQTADVDPHAIDTFSRIVSPPTWVAGAGAGSLYPYACRRGVDVRGTEIPFSLNGNPVLKNVGSYIGAWYKPWTDPTNDCGGLDNCFAGWKDEETWYRLMVGAHPTDMAGMTVQVRGHAGAQQCNYGGGLARARGFEVVARSAPPTDTWQGAPVGRITPDDTWQTMSIPGASIPAPGGELWIGIRAGWRCSYGATACGWCWPTSSGAGDSGKGSVHAQAATWATWTSSGDDMGAAAVADSAPWEGGNRWREAGLEGSPISGIDGQAYYVTAQAPGGRGLSMVGEREDEDEPDGPWSDTAWGVAFTFEVDAAGDTVTPGPRHIEVTTTGEGERTVGTIHLGDAVTPAGISVGGPTTTAFAAVAIEAGVRYGATFDSRSGRMRGKLWKVVDGEPATPDVEVAMAETEDDGDRFSLWVRCGNGEGSPQTVRIHRLDAQAGASDGQRVVREWLGFASGTTNRFTTCHAFRAGTLRVHVNGVGIAPSSEDGAAAAFALDLMPTAHSVLRATYIVDQGG